MITLKETDHPLPAPLKESKRLLSIKETDPYKKIIWLGDSKVGRFNVSVGVPFLENVKKFATLSNAPKTRRKLFFLGKYNIKYPS